MASSSSSVQQKHQVFLSFRGEDTRYNFTSHLYAALQRKAIKTFIDYELPRGEKISPALLKAIEESEISIVILSKHYASSSWCLEELCKILECKNTHGQMVIPIFYHVDPSEVRKQTGTFEEAFAKHEQDLERIDKVQRWRDALKEIGNLSGWHLQAQQKDRSESEHIEEIVKIISKELICKSSTDLDGLIGLNSCIEQIESLLCLNLEEVRVVGIWGMGGIGKTTLAEAVFNKNIVKFEGCCFLSNVREEYEKYGQVHLQEKLLSTILEERNLCISTRLLPNCITNRLHCKKVLIVLDDVNDSSQLELLPEKHYFGPGSKIIVTSRDKHVLQQVADENIYEVEGLIGDEALQLFSLNAFKQRHPMEGWMELSKKVIDYAKGFPLALKVLGSALYRKNKQEWESELNKLKKILNPKMHKLLRISYDGLDDEVKDIFLDIACFFRREHRDYVAKILDGCYSSVHAGISVLIDKSLVTMWHNMLGMHDLIQEMGWNIVRQESIKEPGRRSRLWNLEDVYHVLRNNSGTKAVEGIFLDMSKIREVHLKKATFARMYNLRLLNFYYSDFKKGHKVYLSQNALECLSDKLRYLRWDRYPLKYLPSGISLENLVELNMTHSDVERLWNGVQNLVKLKRLDLSHSQHLKEIPDLSHATNLERIYLEGCTSLVGVPSSIVHLNKLSYLSLRDCENLRNLPNTIYLRSLETLWLSGCSKIKLIPDLSHATNLESISLDGCTSLVEVPSSIGCLNKLSYLNLHDCENLRNLPNTVHFKSLKSLSLCGCSNIKLIPDLSRATNLEVIYLDGCTSLVGVPSSIGYLNKLRHLSLRDCQNLRNLPNTIHLRSLETLNLSGCSNIKLIPDLSYATNLEDISLDGCTSLVGVPSSIGHLNKLRYLRLGKCENLRNLPNTIHLRYLETLDLSSCSNIKLIPDLSHAINLERIYLDGCTTLVEVPSSIWHLNRLRHLSLRDCENLRNLPNTIHLRSLQTLWLSGCSNVTKFPEILETMERLDDLRLNGLGIEDLPSSIEHLIDLQSLELRNCKKLKKLPSSIWKLKSLKLLDLSECSNLRMFPEAPEYIEEVTFSFPSEFKRGLDKLNELHLENCTQLESLPNSLSDMRSLQTLNLAGCSKLMEWQDKLKNSKSVYDLLEFPGNLTCMTWLKDLDLSGNNFESIPPSIKQLSVLRTLDLSYCKRLKSIPELPPSLYHLVAGDCTALEVVSLTEVLKEWGLFPLTSLINILKGICFPPYYEPRKFGFTNCLKLDQHTVGNIVAEAHFRFQQRARSLATACEELKCSINFEMETKILEMSSMIIDFPGSEIPEWLDHRSIGSTINIQLPQHWFDFKFVGFTVCLVFAFEDYDDDKPLYFSFRCQCTRWIVPQLNFYGYKLHGRNMPILTDHVYLGYTFLLCSSIEHHSNEVSFDIDVIDGLGKPVDGCKVKRCGVHVFIPDENLDTECNPNHYPIVEDGSVSKRCRDDDCYNDATPSNNSSSDEEEVEPFPKRLKY